MRRAEPPCGCHAWTSPPLARAGVLLLGARCCHCSHSLLLFSLSCSHRGERHCRCALPTSQRRRCSSTAHSSLLVGPPRSALQPPPTTAAIRALVRHESASPSPHRPPVHRGAQAHHGQPRSELLLPLCLVFLCCCE
jgi:hypothetical protein